MYKVEKKETILGASSVVQKKDLFCVLTRIPLFPDKPSYVRLTYDQRGRLELKGLEEQEPENN